MIGAGVGSLIAHHWRRHRLPLLPMMVALVLFELVITQMAPAPDEVGWAGRILAAVPPQLLALAGADISATPASFIAIGYGHPFFMLLLSLWIVRVSSASIAGEIGAGTMDLLASRPPSRATHVIAAAVSVASGLALLTGAAWTGTWLGLHLRPLGITAGSFLPVAGAAWLLFAAWSAVGLIVSASRRDSGSAIGWTSALMATAFVLDYLARLWKPMAASRPLSLFAYYAPQQILKGGMSRLDLACLISVTIAGLAVATVIIRRRDL